MTTPTEDPNVHTTAEGEEVVLEPGDPGYVEPGTAPTPVENEPPLGEMMAPGMPPQPHAEGEALNPPLPPPPPETQVGLNLTHERLPGESDAEFLARTRNVVVESQSPTDIVPNTPQIRPFPSEEEIALSEAERLEQTAEPLDVVVDGDEVIHDGDEVTDEEAAQAQAEAEAQEEAEASETKAP